MDRQKTALIDALAAKGTVLCCQFLLQNKPDSEKDSKSSDAVVLDDIDAVRRDLLKFVDQKESSVCRKTSTAFKPNFQATLHIFIPFVA